MVLPLPTCQSPDESMSMTETFTLWIVPATVASVTKSFFGKFWVVAVTPTPLIVMTEPVWESTSYTPSLAVLLALWT